MLDKKKSFISAVVYVCNNSDVIEEFLQKLSETLKENFEKFEIICVDDASHDNSAELIKKQGSQLGSNALSIVKMSCYQGLEAAMHAGVDLSIGDFVFEFDSAHMDYPQGLIMEVYEKCLSGFDIVAAGTASNRISSKIFYRVYNKKIHSQYNLSSESFRIISRRSINRVYTMSKTVPYRKALYANCGLKLSTISYKPEGQSRQGRGDKELNRYRRKTAMDTLIIFTDVAYRLSIIMTCIMMFLSLAGGVYTVVIFTMGRPVAGYTTTMLVLTVSFFAVFLILAIIIKYLSVLVNMVFLRQSYMVEGVEKVK